MISTINIFFPNKVPLTETSDGWWLTHKCIQRVGELPKDHVKYVAQLFIKKNKHQQHFSLAFLNMEQWQSMASSKIDRRHIRRVVIMKQAG